MNETEDTDAWLNRATVDYVTARWLRRVVVWGGGQPVQGYHYRWTVSPQHGLVVADPKGHLLVGAAIGIRIEAALKLVVPEHANCEAGFWSTLASSNRYHIWSRTLPAISRVVTQGVYVSEISYTGYLINVQLGRLVGRS